ncbi:hypothetical protein NARC_110021 [Candidatus Nitrosocosmicus arcticus]|uniref:Uncharacterized protein n=1 Tax=Candidatus Nitrosocosmicus arcticus TaxID=2035267 RepID=A0A557ST89_9ARCH|nr:hypothetical protein NARC_110021 [Candidatus Nitrosocosmicus arcticus]
MPSTLRTRIQILENIQGTLKEPMKEEISLKIVANTRAIIFVYLYRFYGPK